MNVFAVNEAGGSLGNIRHSDQPALHQPAQ